MDIPQPASLRRYRCELRHIELLDAEEERRLARAWATGDVAAGARLLEASLPFVLRIARRYRRWCVPLEDLVQQGNLGLLRAVKKFDAEKSCRLATYASYWIRAEIREYVVRNYRIVRLGSTRSERRAMRAFRSRPIATVEDLADETGMPLGRATLIWPLLSQADVALDRPMSGGDSPFEHLAADGIDPEEALEREDERAIVGDALRRVLDDLDERERRIVEARMMSDEPLTLGRLAMEMGVSKERVRQIEQRVKAKLRLHLADLAPAA